jgi:uncharacterized protein YndB with AHSA1/START domain
MSLIDLDGAIPALAAVIEEQAGEDEHERHGADGSPSESPSHTEVVGGFDDAFRLLDERFALLRVNDLPKRVGGFTLRQRRISVELRDQRGGLGHFGLLKHGDDLGSLLEEFLVHVGVADVAHERGGDKSGEGHAHTAHEGEAESAGLRQALGDDAAMHPHAVTVIGPNPDTGEAWFWEYLEQGMTMTGPAWVEEGVVHADLTLRITGDGEQPMHATYAFPEDGVLTWSGLDDAGAPIMNFTFERVERGRLGEWVKEESMSDMIDGGLFAEEPTDRAIVVEREIDAPVAEVWRVWTTNEGFRDVFQRATNIDLRIGGPFEIFWDTENRIGSNGCQFLSVSRHRHIAFSWNAPPSIPSIREKRTVVTVTFEDLAGGRTKMTLVNDGYGAGADWDEAFAYFENAWPWVTGQVAEYFAKEE